MNTVLEYIKYRWKAKGRHGIHSPFVYDFVDRCLRIRPHKELYTLREDLHKSLSKDSRTIRITDFGAGSKKLGNERKISQIYGVSSSKGKKGILLYKISRHYRPANILEFGTSLGVGTMHLALGHLQGSVTTVEACPETHAMARENFSRFGMQNISSLNMTFDQFLDNVTEKQFDLVFIDGHHDGEAMLRYLERLKPFIHEDTIILLDDIRWSDSMLSAFSTVISDHQFHVTMDLFTVGIVLQRPQQLKEHFILKW